jgi:hypothetical protein
MPVGEETHSHPVHIGIFGKQVFEFLLEGMIGILTVESAKNKEDTVSNTILFPYKQNKKPTLSALFLREAEAGWTCWAQKYKQ